jgi:hypothetical protein
MVECANQCLLSQLKRILERESVQATLLIKVQPAQFLVLKVQLMDANINLIKNKHIS